MRVETTVAAGFCALLAVWFEDPALARAADIIVPSSLTGGYSADGTFGNSPAFQNYRAGHGAVTTVSERRNFFQFDLTAYGTLPPGTIASVALKIYLPKFAPGMTIDPGDGYAGPDPFEIFRVTPSTFTSAEVADPTNTPAEAMAIFGTLGTGPIAGEVAISPTDMGTFVTIPLTPGAVTAINAMFGSGVLTLGGRVTTLSFIPPDELVFGFTDSVGPHMAGKMPSLEVTFVPAPSVLTMLAANGLFTIRRRR